MALIHHLALGVEADVPDMQVAGFCEQPRPGWIEGPAPWPRDDFGVAIPPTVEEAADIAAAELQAVLDEISAAAEAAASQPQPPDPKD